MNGSPDDARDLELEARYRRAADSDPSRPPESVRHAILVHAAERARARAASEPPPAMTASAVPARRTASSWRWPVLFGSLAAAAVAGLMVLPHLHPAPSPPVANEPAGRHPASPATSPPPMPAVSPGLAAAPAVASAVAPASAAEALRHAAATGDLESLRSRLDAGVPIEARDAQGRTALWLAAFHGQREIVRYLLARGADPNATDRAGTTPSRAAELGRHAALAAQLRDAAARGAP